MGTAQLTAIALQMSNTAHHAWVLRWMLLKRSGVPYHSNNLRAAAHVVLIAALCEGPVMLLLGAPLALRKIAPNSWYGLRTGKTLSDAGIWYQTNAFSGKAIMAAGFAMLALAAAGTALERTPGVSAGVLLLYSCVAEILPLAFALVFSLVHASRLRRID